MASKPLDMKLYNYVKELANKKFKAPSGIYRSSWIVKEYKRRGGKYSGTVNKNTGLHRWFRENWVDLNRPVLDKKGVIKGYEKCGRNSTKKGQKGQKEKYPLCRPSKKVTKSTPVTYKELSSKSIKDAKRLKEKYKERKNIAFVKHIKT